MRNPNGYGGITKLPGNRRNPYRVRITSGWIYNEETGRSKQDYKTLGYYPTRKDAMLALAAYNANPYDLDADKITFAEIYNKYISLETIPESMKRQYKAAYKNLEPLHNMKLSQLRKMHLQNALDANAGKSGTYLIKMRALIKNIYTFAMDNDIIQKDYSNNLKISPEKKKENIHKPFTSEEIRLLWDNLDMAVPLRISAKTIIHFKPADTILICIYTGMRPGELLQLKCADVNLEEKYMIGGFKTEAGTNRIIPIHNEILPLIKNRVDTGSEYLVPYKSELPPKNQQYQLNMFNPVINALGLSHLPHDGRHTFATFADKYISDKFLTKRILGHAIEDITQNVYTHKDASELVAAVNLIKFM